jgi:hypothetical protein
MSEAARLLSLSERKMALMCAKGEIASRKIGSRRYVPMSEVRRFALASLGTGAHQPAPSVAGLVAGSVSEGEEETQEDRAVS